MGSMPPRGPATDLLTEASETGRFSIAANDPRERWEAADQLLRTYFAQEDGQPSSDREPLESTPTRAFTLTPYGMAEAMNLLEA
jgi:hypothetical protein